MNSKDSTLAVTLPQKEKRGHSETVIIFCLENNSRSVFTLNGTVTGNFSHFRYLATTHFEPTYARSAFPCFDEPQFKAKFKLSIFRDRFHIALCNMPVMNTEDAGFYMGTGLVSFKLI